MDFNRYESVKDGGSVMDSNQNQNRSAAAKRRLQKMQTMKQTAVPQSNPSTDSSDVTDQRKNMGY